MANLKMVGQDIQTVEFTYTNGELTGYPVANLQTYDENEQFRAQLAVSGDYIKLDVGAGGVRARTAVAIVNHNFNGLMTSGVIKVQGSNNSSFSSGVTDLVNPLVVTSDPIYATFPSNSNQYYRIQFAGNMSTTPRVGQIFIDAGVDFGFPYDLPYKKDARLYRTTEREMLDGLIRTHQAADGRRTFKFAFKGEKGGITDAVATDWRAHFKRMRGKLRPFVMLDADGTSTYYVYLDHDEDPLETFRYNINGLELKFKEARAK